ncbi:SPFH domain-containing protein [Caldithrix abyssi]
MTAVFLSIFILLIIVFAFLFEFRQRRPDQIVLADVQGKIIQRKARFYPRHFSLAVPATLHSMDMEFESEARGKLPVKIKLTISTAADDAHLTELVRAGGWNSALVQKASKELGLFVQALTGGFCQALEIEELSSKDLQDFLQTNLIKEAQKLGLKLLGVNVQLIEPLDSEIAEAMQQQEAARIREKTEKVNQKARLEASRFRFETDEKIRRMEHELRLKQLELQKTEQQREAELSRYQVEQELERRRLQMELEKEELKIFEQHPELILLSPQIARLAEASQQLKNAKTVVSLTGGDLQKGINVLEIIEQTLQKVLQKKTT